MLWSKAGVSLYAGQVVTRQDTLAKDKELCRAVTEALTEGLAYALKDPAAGVDIFIKEVPEMGVTSGGRENARIAQGLMHYTLLSKEAQEPIFLTRNGEGEMVFAPIELWEKLTTEAKMTNEKVPRIPAIFISVIILR